MREIIFTFSSYEIYKSLSESLLPAGCVAVPLRYHFRIYSTDGKRILEGERSFQFPLDQVFQDSGDEMSFHSPVFVSSVRCSFLDERDEIAVRITVDMDPMAVEIRKGEVIFELFACPQTSEDPEKPQETFERPQVRRSVAFDYREREIRFFEVEQYVQARFSADLNIAEMNGGSLVLQIRVVADSGVDLHVFRQAISPHGQSEIPEGEPPQEHREDQKNEESTDEGPPPLLLRFKALRA